MLPARPQWDPLVNRVMMPFPAPCPLHRLLGKLKHPGFSPPSFGCSSPALTGFLAEQEGSVPVPTPTPPWAPGKGSDLCQS